MNVSWDLRLVEARSRGARPVDVAIISVRRGVPPRASSSLSAEFGPAERPSGVGETYEGRATDLRRCLIAPLAPVVAAKRPVGGACEAEAWHLMNVADVASKLGTSLRSGLSEAEAARRLAEHGPNELEASAGIAPWRVLLDQFRNVLIVILLVAVGLSAVLGHVDGGDRHRRHRAVRGAARLRPGVPRRARDGGAPRDGGADGDRAAGRRRERRRRRASSCPATSSSSTPATGSPADGAPGRRSRPAGRGIGADGRVAAGREALRRSSATRASRWATA